MCMSPRCTNEHVYMTCSVCVYMHVCHACVHAHMHMFKTLTYFITQKETSITHSIITWAHIDIFKKGQLCIPLESFSKPGVLLRFQKCIVNFHLGNANLSPANWT